MLVTIVIPKKTNIGLKCFLNTNFTLILKSIYFPTLKKLKILHPTEVRIPKIAY